MKKTGKMLITCLLTAIMLSQTVMVNAAGIDDGKPAETMEPEASIKLSEAAESDSAFVGEAYDKCTYDPSTGTLYLAGTMNENNSIEAALGDTEKTQVKAVQACEGTVLPTNSGSLFAGFTGMESIDLKKADSSGVTDMRLLFANCSSLKTLDVSSLNTSSVGGEFGFIRMFAGCSSLESITLGGSFSTAGATKLTSLFSGCSSLKSIDLSKLNTASAWDISHMFDGCASLTSLNTEDMSIASVYGRGFVGLFAGCSSLTELDLSHFNTGSIDIMANLFSGCSSLKKIYVGSGWRVGHVSESQNMFSGCTSLVGEQGTAFDPNGKTDKTFAIIDHGTKCPGYLTAKGVVETEKKDLTTVTTRMDATIKVNGDYYRTYSYTGEPVVPKEIWVYEYYNGTSSYRFLERSDYFLEITDNIYPGYGKVTVSPTEWGRFTFEPVTAQFPINKGKIYPTYKSLSATGAVGQKSNISIVSSIEEGGTVSEAIRVTDSSAILEGDPELIDGKLYYVVKNDDSLAKKTATITLQVRDCRCYEDYNIVITVTAEANCDHKNTEIRNKEEATCVKEGYTGDKYCKDCGKLLEEGTVIPEDPSAHKYDDGIVTKEPTEDEAGERTFTCIYCNHTYTEEIPKKEKDQPDPGKDDPEQDEPEKEGVTGGGGPTDTKPPVTKKTTSLTLVKGQKFTLPEKDWVCEEKAVLVVSKGNVTAKKAGTAVLKREGQTIQVTVLQPTMEKTLTLLTGETKPTALTNTGELAVQYLSAAPDIATVNERGEVTGVSKGSATISAYVNGICLKCTAKVTEADTKKRTFQDTVSLVPMQSVSVTGKGFKAAKAVWSCEDPSITPKAAEDLSKNVVYEDQIVRITKNGKLTAIGAGTTKLKAACDGTELLFTVKVSAPVTKTVHMNLKASKTLSLYGVKGTIPWAAKNSSVVGIKKNKITALSVGETSLTAKVENFTFRTDVFVEDPALSGSTFSGKPYNYSITMTVGETADITQNKLYQEVLFLSNKCDIAYADKDGKIIARAKGTAKLSAKVNGKTIKITVNVKEKPAT